MMLVRNNLLALILTLSAVACGGEDPADNSSDSDTPTGGTDTATNGTGSSASGTLTSEVDGSRLISSLSPSEFSLIDEKDAAAFDMDAAVQSFCHYLAVAEAGNASSPEELPTACAKAEQTCLATPLAFELAAEDIPRCNATIDEVVACDRETAKRLTTVSAALPTCAALTASNYPSEDPMATGYPTACEVVDTKCPPLAE